MRFMVMVKATQDSEAGALPSEELLTGMGKYNEELAAGIRFRMVDEQDRIRRHIRIFVNGVQSSDLAQSLAETDEVIIVQALSGG